LQHFKHSGTIYRPGNTPIFETGIGEESVVEVCFAFETRGNYRFVDIG
jgi:hypothetical protein